MEIWFSIFFVRDTFLIGLTVYEILGVFWEHGFPEKLKIPYLDLPIENLPFRIADCMSHIAHHTTILTCYSISFTLHTIPHHTKPHQYAQMLQHIIHIEHHTTPHYHTHMQLYNSQIAQYTMPPHYIYILQCICHIAYHTTIFTCYSTSVVYYTTLL